MARPAPDAARAKAAPAAGVAPVASAAKELRDADPAALRTEIRALKRALALAEEKANDADAKRARSVARATATLRRENESLEAHLTLLVQEIGQIKHLTDRVPRLEQELRAKDLQLAEGERTWQAERAALSAEIERLSRIAPRSTGGGKSTLAAVAGASARLGSAR